MKMKTKAEIRDKISKLVDQFEEKEHYCGNHTIGSNAFGTLGLEAARLDAVAEGLRWVLGERG